MHAQHSMWRAAGLAAVVSVCHLTVWRGHHSISDGQDGRQGVKHLGSGEGVGRGVAGGGKGEWRVGERGMWAMGLALSEDWKYCHSRSSLLRPGR